MKSKILICIIVCCCLLNAGEKYSKDLFVTWELFEADKLASIWLIKRFINENAEIRIVSRDSEIKEGNLFDTPDAYFKRTITKSTFEMLQDYYLINDEKVDAIAKLIHDIEINKWDKKLFRQTEEFEDFVRELILSGLSNEETIAESNSYLDKVYQKKKILDVIVY